MFGCQLILVGLVYQGFPMIHTFFWIFKSKATPLKLHSLCFKAHKKLPGSTVLVEFFHTAMLRLIARNMGDKVSNSEGILFQKVCITYKICKIELL